MNCKHPTSCRMYFPLESSFWCSKCGSISIINTNTGKRKEYKPQDIICSKCSQFLAYENSDEEREPNNCTKWLCNDGKCPHEDELYFRKGGVENLVLVKDPPYTGKAQIGGEPITPRPPPPQDAVKKIN